MRIKVSLIFSLGLAVLIAREARADTYVYVQNNTPFAFPVEIVRPSGLSLPTQYWKRGANMVLPGQRARIYQTNRDSGVKSGKYYEFHCMLSFDNSRFGLKQRLKGTTFFSHLWQSVQGQSWYDDRSTHRASWDAGKQQFDIKYRAYFTGGADDVEYIIQYRYPPVTTNPGNLNVLAYNTYMRPTTLFINGQSIRERLMAPQVMGRGYDAIIFSELFDDDIRKSFLSRIRGEFPYQTRVVGTDRGAEQDGGVAIVSKWPIVAEDQRRFGSVSSGSDGMADKGVMYACINKNGEKYHLFGTHTQANKGGTERNVRKRQFQIIREFIASKRIPATDAVIVGGDLNVDRTGAPAEYQEMLDTLNARPPIYVGNLHATWDPTINKCADSGTPEYLDYVLAINGFRAPTICVNEVRLHRSAEEWKTLPTDRARWDLSDHFAVLGLMNFRK